MVKRRKRARGIWDELDEALEECERKAADPMLSPEEQKAQLNVCFSDVPTAEEPPKRRVSPLEPPTAGEVQQAHEQVTHCEEEAAKALTAKSRRRIEEHCFQLLPPSEREVVRQQLRGTATRPAPPKLEPTFPLSAKLRLLIEGGVLSDAQIARKYGLSLAQVQQLRANSTGLPRKSANPLEPPPSPQGPEPESVGSLDSPPSEKGVPTQKDSELKVRSATKLVISVPILQVPFHPAKRKNYCTVACLAMILDFYGTTPLPDQDQLHEHCPYFEACDVNPLRQYQLEPHVFQMAGLEDLRHELARGIPVILRIKNPRTHSIVGLAIDREAGTFIYHDPAKSRGGSVMPLAQLLDEWDQTGMAAMSFEVTKKVREPLAWTGKNIITRQFGLRLPRPQELRTDIRQLVTGDPTHKTLVQFRRVVFEMVKDVKIKAEKDPSESFPDSLFKLFGEVYPSDVQNFAKEAVGLVPPYPKKLPFLPEQVLEAAYYAVREYRVHRLLEQYFREFQLVTNLLIGAGLQMIKAGRLDRTHFAAEGHNAEKRFYDLVSNDESFQKPMQITLEPRLITRGKNAEKTVYLKKSKRVQIKERVWRCGAQVAYFALREVNKRAELLSTLAGTLQNSPILPDLFDRTFPSGEGAADLWDNVYETLHQSALSPGEQSRVYLRNAFRQIRKLVWRALRDTYAKDVEAILMNLEGGSVLEAELRNAFAAQVTEDAKVAKRFSVDTQATVYLRTALGRMTKRLNALLRLSKRILALKAEKQPIPAKFRTFGRLRVDKQIGEIMGRTEAAAWETVYKDRVTIRAQWDSQKTEWRNKVLKVLQGQTVQADTFIGPALEKVIEALREMAPAQFLGLLFDPRPAWVPLIEGGVREFQGFLAAKVESWVREQFLIRLRTRLLPFVRKILTGIVYDPLPWLTRPLFKRQTIPLGIDDNSVLRWAELQRAGVVKEEPTEEAEEGTEKEISSKGGEVSKLIELGFEQYKFLSFVLQTEKDRGKDEPMLDRYIRDAKPLRGTVSLRSGRLVFAVPFARPSQPVDIPNQPQNLALAAGVDLGLKTLATVSIAPLRRSPEIVDSKRRKMHYWEPVDPDNPEKKPRISEVEVARYFFDPSYLSGTRGAWLAWEAPKDAKAKINDSKQESQLKRHLRSRKGIPKALREQAASDPTHQPTNWRRKLFHLQEQARQLQAKMVDYRNWFKGRPAKDKEKKIKGVVRTVKVKYYNSPKYFQLRRAWKRVWTKLNNLHQELARQIATRIVALCKQPYRFGQDQVSQVQLIRLEDLSWATHRSKTETGLFLRTNQIHWFFSQVQTRLIELARREGIAVELVNARGTSTRCSKHSDPREVLRSKEEVSIEEVKKEKKRRKQKVFTCEEPSCDVHHKAAPGKPYRLDADLNAARNILTAVTSPLL